MKHPTKQECMKILDEYGTPDHVRGHCAAVAHAACAIGKALNDHGFSFDIELVRASSLLHDIARTEDRHWDIGAEIARKKGYVQEAEIIQKHMMYTPFALLEEAKEIDIVCLADKLVKEDSYVGIDERIDYIIKKAERAGHPEARVSLLEKKEETKKFLHDIEEVIGISIDELMGRKTDEDR